MDSAYLLDPFYLQHREGRVGGVERLANIAPDRFRRSEYYRNYYRQTTLIDEIAIFARISPVITLTACLGKDRSSGTRFLPREFNALKRYEATLSALMEENPGASYDEVRESLTGNYCRCGTYPHVFDAALEAGRELKRGGR